MGNSLEIETDFKTRQVSNQNPPKCCQNLIGKKLKKTLQFKSKQHLPFLKKGNEITLDYSNFIMDKKDPSLNLEVWKVVNIKTVRADFDDL